MVTIEELIATGEIRFQQPLNEKRLDKLFSYLIQKLPISLKTQTVEIRGYDHTTNETSAHRRVEGVQIGQREQANITFPLRATERHSNEEQTYQAMQFKEPERSYPETQRFNYFYNPGFKGFNDNEKDLLQRIYETTQAYFKEHF